MAPQMCRSTNRQTNPEVWFRVVHVARNGHPSAPVAAYREQAVEIALGPASRFIAVDARQRPFRPLITSPSTHADPGTRPA